MPLISNDSPLSSFSSLGLSQPLLKAIQQLGFEQPSPIQELAIPALLASEGDAVALAQTGTGKTAAFGLPLLQHLEAPRAYVQALILAPTRELAQQITSQLDELARYAQGLEVLTVFGGAPIGPQAKTARQNPAIIVATPGRLIDLMERRAVKLDQLRFLVLDEADEMLNMGFQEELERILTETPSEKATWLFSATMPAAVRKIAKRYLRDPQELHSSTGAEVNTDIAHHYALVHQRQKGAALGRFIDSAPHMRGLVFCRTKRETQELAEALLKRRYRADALHGDLSQPQRDRVMKRFREQELQVLVATDVAARGIDVNDLTHVFHHNLPDDAAFYTHRSGRTARAGKKGLSVVLLDHRDEYKLKRMAKQLGISFQQAAVPTAQDIKKEHLLRWHEEVAAMAPPMGISEDMWLAARERLDHLTREELLARLMQRELDHLSIQEVDDAPRPRQGGKGPKGFKGGKGPRGKKGRYADKWRQGPGKSHGGGRSKGGQKSFRKGKK